MKTSITRNLLAVIFLTLLSFFSELKGQMPINFTVNPQTQCYNAGNNVVYANAASYTSSINSFSWSIQGPGSCSPTIMGFSVTMAQATLPCCGVFTITCVGMNGTTALAFMSKTVSVICANIYISNSSPTICAGSSAVLSATGASSYSWSTGSPFSSIVVSPTATTCYTVWGYSNGCVVNAATCVTVMPSVNISGNLNICAGQSTTLFASGSSSYTWWPGNQNSSSIVVSPTATTCYFVQGSTSGPGSGCNNSDSVCVNVQQAPTINVFGNSTVCAGGWVNLIATGGSSYTWQPGGLTGATITPFINSNTCYTVTAYSPSCGIGSAIKCITAVPYPTVTATASNFTICSGASSTLVASGASSYTWWPSGQTGAVAVVSPTAYTCYSVTGSNGSGCNNTAGVCIFVQPATLAVTGNSVICAGGSATLTASGSAFYNWQPGNLSGSSVVVSPSVTTCYTVTSSGGFCNGTATKCVFVQSPPSVSVAIFNPNSCAGSTHTLMASGASSYTWLPFNMTGSMIVITPTTSMCYTVIGSNGPGCTNSAVGCFSIFPAPVISVTGNANICPANTTTLTASGASSYTWIPGGMTGANIVVAPMSTTCYTVIGSNGFCSGSAVKCVTVISTNISVSGNSVICAGGSSTLSALGSTTFTWMPGNLTGTSIVVSPTATTCYTVTSFNGTCTSSGTKCVIVQSPPAITTSVINNSYCAGSSYTLTASGASTYTWLPFNMTGSSIVITPTTSMCYTVIGSNGPGCINSTTGCFTVIPTPVIITTGSPNICAGSSTTITASGASSYTWIPGGMTGANLVVSPMSTTCYTVIGSNGGCIGYGGFCLIVSSSTISISGNSVICAGGSSTLSASGSTSYTWMPGNMTGTSVVVSPSVTTCYTVASFNGTCTSYASKCVFVQSPPAITTSVINNSYCAGSAYTLTASGASSYTWIPFNMTGSNIVITPTTSMCYTVIGSNGPGCINSTTGCFSVIPIPVLTVTGSSNICSGSSTTLSASGASSYTWIPGGMSGANIVVSPMSTTCYTVIGSNGSCIGSAVKCVTVQSSNLTVSGPSVMCAGASTTLTASGSVSYTWLPGNQTGNSIVVSPSVSTCYTVLGSNGTCGGSGLKCITVQPAPVITTTVLANSYCAGSSFTLTASGAGTYTWLPFNITGPSPVITLTASTCYTVKGMSPAGCIGQATNCFSVIPVTNLTVTGNANICAGGSTTLNASGASGYTWQPGNLSGPSVVISPTSTTCYTVTGSNGNCNSSTVKCVTVQTTNLAVNGNGVICGTGSTTLSVSGSLSYTWMPGNITGNSIVVSPTVNTCYTVTGSNGSCISTGVKCVTIQQAGLITISGNTNVCKGSTTSFLASGANSYTWNTGANNALITVLPSTNTCFYVNGTTSGGCPASGSICVNVLPLPTVSITGNNVICTGQQGTVLHATGAQNYTWSTGAPSPSIFVNPPVSTTYTVYGVGSNGCTGKATVTVTIKPTPTLMVVPHDSIICPGEQVFLAVSGAQSYSWSNGANTPSILVSPTANVTYTVNGSTNGCSSTAIINIIVSNCTGVSKNHEANHTINLYPNPVQNVVSIISNSGDNVSYSLFDATGRLVLEGSFTKARNVNMSELPDGIYIIRFDSTGRTTYQKIVLQK
jgi:hypothetical protein